MLATVIGYLILFLPSTQVGEGLPNDLQLHSQAIVSADRFKRAVHWELLILNKDWELEWVQALWGEWGRRRAWKVCWIPELTLSDKLDAKCCLERQDKISEDRGIKGSAASEILLKHFSYHCTSLSVQSPHFLMGTISVCLLFTKTVIGGHLSKPLSFW